MKLPHIFLAVSLLFVFTNCKKDDDDEQMDNEQEQNEPLSVQEDIEGLWNMVNISGGFAGLDCDYPAGDISWTFGNDELTRINNHTGGGTQLCDGSVGPNEETTDPYSILESDDLEYLIIDDMESGSITISNDTMIIDGNQMSSGAGADFFIYRFER